MQGCAWLICVAREEGWTGVLGCTPRVLVSCSEGCGLFWAGRDGRLLRTMRPLLRVDCRGDEDSGIPVKRHPLSPRQG